MADQGNLPGGTTAATQVGAIDFERLALQSLPYGVVIADEPGTILFVNDEAARQFGCRPDELVGSPIETLLVEGQRAAHAQYRHAFDSHPSPRPMHGRRLTGRRRDGSEFSLEIGLQPARTERGPVTVALLRDLSERRQATLFSEEGDFERFIADRAPQFINLPPERVDAAILDMLKEVVLNLDLDRASASEVSGQGLARPVRWTRSGLPPGPETMTGARLMFPWCFERLDRCEIIRFSSLSEVPHEADRQSFADLGVKSGFIVPLWVEGEFVGIANFFTMREERSWPPHVVSHLQLAATVLGTTFARRRADTSLRNALTEVERLRDQLKNENVYLQSAVRGLRGPTTVVGESRAVHRLLTQLRQVAPSDTTVLLTGETGTGKELVAEQIHDLSRRRSRTMVRVNCAALPSALLESELFGRERGAYTGAESSQAGRFELADKSTLFLDEIGELPPEAQVKLLRVLEQRTIERLGSSRPIRIDTRLIVATNRDLERLVGEGKFRADLYYRLNVFPLRVPPLRERIDDIPALVQHFVRELSGPLRKHITAIEDESMAALQAYGWPGNVRELRNVVERALIVSTGPELTIAAPVPSGGGPSAAPVKLEDVEREHIRRVLDRTLWRIRGPAGAAEQLGIKPTTLETRMAKLGLTRRIPEP